MKKLVTAALIMLFSTWASASIVYSVNRTIGAGTVVGSIETDGTLGTLNASNILDWTFTLTSPTLSGGSPDIITKTGAIQTNEFGGFLTATLSDLLFDFSAGPAAAGFMLFQGGSTNYWCVQTNGCFDNLGSREALGFGTTGLTADIVGYRTQQVIASVTNAVPEPTVLSLMAISLLVLGFSRRKHN